MIKENTIFAFKILKPFGIKGFSKINCLIDINQIDKYAPFFDKLGVIFTIEQIIKKSNIIAIKFLGIDSPEAVKKLSGLELFFDSKKLPSLKEEEYYIAELLGANVLLNNQPIGKVIGIDNFGAEDLINISTIADGKEYYVPFTTECFHPNVNNNLLITDFGYNTYILGMK